MVIKNFILEAEFILNLYQLKNIAMSQTQYLWIPVIGCIVGFVYAFGIGANDVANAFATSVSSKSITLKQAVIIASIFEFSGAMFLGASVTGTVRGKIFDTDVYEDEPEIVMLGMMTSLIVATFMLLGATYFGLPVSTTHTVSSEITNGFMFKAADDLNLTLISLTYLKPGCWLHHWLLGLRKRLFIN